MKVAAKKKEVHGSQAARRSAGVVLEVLAGHLSPSEAAAVLEISVPGYYMLESRALDGLVDGCEPRPKGRVRTAADEVRELKKECARLKRECVRYQTLARVAQRTDGIAVPTKKRDEAKQKRKRRPVVRALKAARQLKPEPEKKVEENRAQAGG